MAALPYMPLYVADYLADAAHLSTLEHGAYLLLIMTYWQRGQPLPDDDKKLSRIARLSPDEWADLRESISEFFDVDAGLWTHGRIEMELDKVREKSDKARRGGKARAKQANSERSADAQQTLSRRSADAEQTASDTDTDTDTSIPTTSGAPAPLDPKSVVFSTGLRLLTDAGTPQRAGRSHLAKLCKTYGDETVANAVAEAERCRPVEPSSYLERLCRGANNSDLLAQATGGIPWS